MTKFLFHEVELWWRNLHISISPWHRWHLVDIFYRILIALFRSLLVLWLHKKQFPGQKKTYLIAENDSRPQNPYIHVKTETRYLLIFYNELIQDSWSYHIAYFFNFLFFLLSTWFLFFGYEFFPFYRRYTFCFEINKIWMLNCISEVYMFNSKISSTPYFLYLLFWLL